MASAGGVRPKRFKNTVSVSRAFTMACFQFSWTGLSVEATIRVPICTPSAPSAKAAAILRPSIIPPAAITGMFTFAHTSDVRTMVATPRLFL
jgi:hypothetical protein